MEKQNIIIPKNGRSIVIDPALDKYQGKVLCKEKVERAKRILAESPIPEELRR